MSSTNIKVIKASHVIILLIRSKTVILQFDEFFPAYFFLQMSDYSPDFVFLHQPDESVADDFLFPMSSGISYNSSPESDGEFCEPETPRNMSRQPSEEPSHMSRFNSDPNLANLEENDAGNANRRLPPQTPVSLFVHVFFLY